MTIKSVVLMAAMIFMIFASIVSPVSAVTQTIVATQNGGGTQVAINYNGANSGGIQSIFATQSGSNSFQMLGNVNLGSTPITQTISNVQFGSNMKFVKFNFHK